MFYSAQYDTSHSNGNLDVLRQRAAGRAPLQRLGIRVGRQTSWVPAAQRRRSA